MKNREVILMVVLGVIWLFILGAHHMLLPNGYPNPLYGGDHPFHLMKAQHLIDFIEGRDTFFWNSRHNGGYPIRCYPPGTT